MEFKEEYLKEAYKNEKDLPTKVRIDVSTVCQLHCPSCYMRKSPEKVKNGCGIGHLKFEDFKNFIDLNPNIKEIELSNSGEIFLNPDFIKIIEYAHSKNIKQTANNGVNLNYLTEEQAEAMVKNNFACLTVSIDGASQKTYEKYQIGGNFKTVIENIKKITKYKKQYDSKTPYITWKYVIFGHNEKDIPKAKKLAKELGLHKLRFEKPWENSFPIKDAEFVKQETGIDSLKTYYSPIEHLLQSNQQRVEWFYCEQLWTEPQINWDGQFLGCCCNFEKHFIKNVFNKKLIEILNEPTIIYAKNMIQGKAPANKNIPCNNCYIYEAMANSNIWFKKQNKD